MLWYTVNWRRDRPDRSLGSGWTSCSSRNEEACSRVSEIYRGGMLFDPSSKKTQLRIGNVSLTFRSTGISFGARTENWTSLLAVCFDSDPDPNFNANPARRVVNVQLSSDLGPCPK